MSEGQDGQWHRVRGASAHATLVLFLLPHSLNLGAVWEESLNPARAEIEFRIEIVDSLDAVRSHCCTWYNCISRIFASAPRVSYLK